MVEIDEIADEINITEDGGIKKKILLEGSGELYPTDGQEITAHYTGRLLDGTVFDSSYNRNEPFKFTIGKGQVIKTWDLGFAKMKKGEKAILTGESKYAYGENGSPPTIPPNATLEFEVELLDFKDKPKEKWEMTAEEKQIESLKYKDLGKTSYQQQEFQAAYEFYKTSLDYIEDLEEYRELKINLYLNLSIVTDKLQEWNDSSNYSKQVLDLDESNIKGLYRYAIANSNLWNIDTALTHMNKILEIEPNNKLAESKIIEIKRKHKSQLKKESKMYSNMLNGLS